MMNNYNYFPIMLKKIKLKLQYQQFYQIQKKIDKYYISNTILFYFLKLSYLIYLVCEFINL